MKNLFLISAIVFASVSVGCKNAKAESANGITVQNDPQPSDMPAPSAAPDKTSAKIQVAILLDTSNSMDGLIEQAKSRLWNIVNTLTTLRLKGKTPQIEIALYEYGNDNLNAETGYVRCVTPLTTNLDLISEKLFSLTTNGGLEYCGTVIHKAVKQLEWGKDEADIRLIYIAGNEEFNQGKFSYKEAASEAVGRGIYVSTIHCGNRESGVSGFWQDGAVRGKGKFFNIDQNRRVRYIVTPYDDRIDACNTRLNGTYIVYGRAGETYKENQMRQDRNAESISKANKAERIVSKSKAVYKNTEWDMVDMMAESSDALDKVSAAELPAELKGKSKAEMKAYVDGKAKERAQIQKEIAELSKQRQAYIEAEQKKGGEDEDDLGKAINESLLAVANAKGYSVE